MTVERLIDVSRLVSRAGLISTGVDRVEFAYLRQIAMDTQAKGLARTALGYVLLDQAGLTALLQADQSGDWRRPDVLSRWNRRLTDAAKRGQSFVRHHAIARCRPNGLRGMLSRQMSGTFVYYNVGHSNLSQRTLAAISLAGGRSTILVHDTIPLDLPDMQREGTVKAFARKLANVERHAGRIVVSTKAVAADCAYHFDTVPDQVVAPLGVDLAKPEPISPALEPKIPYFMTVGTIEPRKNHALLLDIWEGWEDPPTLLICGRRGWKNEKVFARLDAGIPGVVEMPNLTDGQIATLLRGAEALLFPSFAEGFGLPPVEAQALGTPVIVSDLPACKEVLGDGAVYLDPTDRYAWEKTLKKKNLAVANGTKMARTPPDWDTHFKLVFTDGW